jgi:hypothetical protein
MTNFLYLEGTLSGRKLIMLMYLGHPRREGTGKRSTHSMLLSALFLPPAGAPNLRLQPEVSIATLGTRKADTDI